MSYISNTCSGYGSLLGPALANNFVGYYEKKRFTSVENPLLYTRFVEDTFVVVFFRSETKAKKFFTTFNSLHSALKLTTVKEANQTLPFLDVKIEKDNGQFLTSIYRKFTFTGQYIRWNLFGPSKRKTNLIGTLIHRALVICSKSKLQQELDFIRSILRQNDYSEVITISTISKNLPVFINLSKKVHKNVLFYLKLSLISNILLKFEKQVKSNVQKCFSAVELRVIFPTHKILPSIHKDAVPISQQSLVVYLYVCRCDCRLVGRTFFKVT